jgi:hypothetical protein
MHLWHDPLTSKDLLEACVVFATALTFVILGQTMGFRFFRRVRIAPGFRVNLSKRGVSLSAGGRGHWFTIGPRGVRTTVGSPGTGLYYTATTGRPKKRRAGSSHLLGGVVLVLFLFGMLQNAFGSTGTWLIIAGGVALCLFFILQQIQTITAKQQSQSAAADWINEQIGAGKQFKLICGDTPSIALDPDEELLGSFPETRLISEKMQAIDEGAFLITNRRLFFIGVKRTISLPLKEIIEVDKYEDTVGLHCQGKVKVQCFQLNGNLTVRYQRNEKDFEAPINGAMVKALIDSAAKSWHSTSAAASCARVTQGILGTLNYQSWEIPRSM